MKKRILIATIFLCVLLTSLSAQASIDPSHRFYEYAQNWALQGLITNVPPLRPYPLANIKEMLTAVIENGSERDVEIAKQLWEEETGRVWHAQLTVDASTKLSSVDESIGKEDFLLAICPSAFGELSFFNDFLSMGYDIGIDGFALGNKHAFHPLYTNRIYDFAEDPVSAGPFTAYIDINDAISVGSTNVFFQGGLNRRGYGAILEEGTMLNDTAFHTPNFSYTVQNSFFSFTQLISMLAAGNSYGSGSYTFDKYFAFHAIELNLFSGKFSIAYTENIIFGERFDPSYLLPVPFMAIQTLYTAADNLQMGLVFKLKPVSGLQFSTEIYVDDVDVNNMLKLNFDTRNRFALLLGAQYAPKDSVCTNVQASYLMITPFMYTHWQYESATSGLIPVGIINYSDYTHYGMSMGTPVPPNSDRIGFKINLTPVKDFNLSVTSSFVRHGNVVESFTDSEAIQFLLAQKGQYSTNGSIFTHSMFENTTGPGLNVIPTGHQHLNYLTQEHIMYVIQAGVDADYTFFRQKWGTLSVTFGYDFECIINKGVDSHLYPGGQVVYNGDGTYSIEGVSGSKTQAETVAYFKDAWVNALHTVFNHYVTLGVRYTF